jgi:LPS sulfotransferase NodH
MNKFVILTEIRTGYKWLASLICSHPKAFSFGEIFGSVRGVRQSSMFTQPLTAIKEKEDPVIWLKGNVEKWAMEKKLDVVGFKVNYVDGKYNENWDSLWKYIKSDFKIIHLTRNNLLDRALSELLASKEKNWSTHDYKAKIHIEPNHLLRIMHRSEWWQKEFRKKFKGMFELTYEEMMYNPEKLLEMQGFLGLEPQVLGSHHKKQRQFKQSHYIKNYGEISGMIREYFPCYKYMLDDPQIKM